jgi:dethiobiotin synthase
VEFKAMSFFVSGTDTNVGKTVASAWLMLHLKAAYWKPVQSGSTASTDKQTVKTLTEAGEDLFFPSTYEFAQPLSPHEAAARDSVRIDLDRFVLPDTGKPLIVEGAGGLLVPLNENRLMIDLIERLALPVILVCRSGLGTINHTLLSLEALKARKLSVAGLIINGSRKPHNRQALELYGKVPIIAEIDWLDPMDRDALLAIKPENDLAKYKVE